MPTRSRYIRHSAPRPSHFDLRAARRVIVDVLQDNIKRIHKYPPSRSGVFIGSAGTNRTLIRSPIERRSVTN